jgi:hypothetical protein
MSKHNNMNIVKTSQILYNYIQRVHGLCPFLILAGTVASSIQTRKRKEALKLAAGEERNIAKPYHL